jgi:hypothetical protein
LFAAFSLFIFLTSVGSFSNIFRLCRISAFAFLRWLFLFTALIVDFWNGFYSLFVNLICGLYCRWKSSHFLFWAFIIKFCVLPYIFGVQEGTNWEDEYCVSSAMKTTLNRLLSGVGSLATYLVYLLLRLATKDILSLLPKLFISLRISTTYNLI